MDGLKQKPVEIKVFVSEDANEVILSPLIFDIASIEAIRKIGITGTLSGTLPLATQQNLFLSVPLKLMVEEAIWLYINGCAKFSVMNGPISSRFSELLDSQSEQLEQESKLRLQKSFELQKKYKQEQHILKMKKLGIESRIDKGASESNALIESSLFVRTSDTSDLMNHFSNQQISGKIINYLVANYSSWDNYLLFQSLREQNYIMSPGARFGGKYIAYPGDPLNYHSHMTVRNALDYYNEPIDMLELACGARLGTTVKKLWVIGGVKHGNREKSDRTVQNLLLNKEDDVSFFSVEWAGFG
ncbi:hypothetical protein KAFR_0A06460 [Kazachstania africana CBS 2517]|uniref:tRNA-splicing endonuclease subunit Sen34 n=1 Tax=Kazachstania africana (strain ATCC 22294 / BCRC 22015 / CBS 2517 / CECT 1963 / NBRC 1671 / NRRL Y-8276) TaxID=1071382 RepID=H2ANY1_KAZAF|nr:hypothetical protein KAFR_0A06460 [Kazachstania africana CBS 2517]CCF56081.1 hypothetical protein KAFR_0A06460 [Kazachstania africana CBS 2517]